MKMAKGFSRRAVLRGAGVALALPWLESLAPRGARGQAPAPRRTFVSFFFPCGTPDYWRPAAPGVGDGWALSPILEPLAPLKSRVTVLGNVGNYGPFGGHITPSHSHLTASFLTCTKAKVGPPSTLGISVDQVIANALGARTRIPSLQLGLSTMDSSLYGLPPEFSRSISWASSTEPLYKVVSPQKVFDRLVASNPVPGLPGQAADVFAASRRAAHKSVLDYVATHTTSVRATLGRADQQRMDEFLASVRSLEKRVDAGSVGGCVVPSRPTADYAVGDVPADYNRNTHADLMIDLAVMALACDLTRVVSFMLDDSRSDFVYDFLQDRTFGPEQFVTSVKTSGLHGLSESGNQSNAWATIDRWFVEKLARFCGKLDATSEGTGTMLDGSTVWFGSECHNGNEDALDLPVLYVGGGGGRLATNRFIDFASTARQTERLANVYLTFLRGVFDLPDTAFGTSLGGENIALPPHTFGGGTELVPEILA